MTSLKEARENEKDKRKLARLKFLVKNNEPSKKDVEQKKEKVVAKTDKKTVKKTKKVGKKNDGNKKS